MFFRKEIFTRRFSVSSSKFALYNWLLMQVSSLVLVYFLNNPSCGNYCKRNQRQLDIFLIVEDLLLLIWIKKNSKILGGEAKYFLSCLDECPNRQGKQLMATSATLDKIKKKLNILFFDCINKDIKFSEKITFKWMSQLLSLIERSHCHMGTRQV